MGISVGFGVGPVRVSVPITGGSKRPPDGGGSNFWWGLAGAILISPVLMVLTALFGFPAAMLILILGMPFTLIVIAALCTCRPAPRPLEAPDGNVPDVQNP